MFSRIAALTGALLIASGPVMAGTEADAVWNGHTQGDSCSLTAGDRGTISDAGGSLTSFGSAGTPATIKYTFDMYDAQTTGKIGFSRGGAKVTRAGGVNGTNVLGVGNAGANHELWIRYQQGGMQDWVRVHQGRKGAAQDSNLYNNQWTDGAYYTVPNGHGNGQEQTLSIDVKTNAHKDGTKKVPGVYTIKTTMECQV